MQKKKGFFDQQPIRLRTPRGREVLGILDQRLGGSRLRVKCLDGKVRLCRIPGRLKRALWVREGDVILIEPWEYDNDRGDVLHKYRKGEVELLKIKGLLKEIEETSEF